MAARFAYALTDRRPHSIFPYTSAEAIAPPPLLTGHHAGCVEERHDFGNACEFDGKLSLAHFRSRYLLYARANTKPAGGGRFVQVASSLADDPSSSYGPFRLLSIDGYDRKGPGNIYLACVNPHPADDTMLIGAFAVNLGDPHPHSHPHADGDAHTRPDDGNTDGPSFIGISLSCNGVDWSQLTPAAPSIGSLGRTYDQPVDGLLTIDATSSDATIGAEAAGGPITYLLIHKDVYGIAPSARQTSRIVRHAIMPRALRRLARAARARGLPGC